MAKSHEKGTGKEGWKKAALVGLLGALALTLFG